MGSIKILKNFPILAVLKEMALDSATSNSILVVDDEDALREALAFEFEMRGFQVDSAENGRKALEIISAKPIGLVMSDIRMPGGSGTELLEELQKRAQSPVLMFMTAFADITAEEAYDKGAAGMFSKPFDRKQMVEMVRRALLPPAQAWSKPSTAPANVKLALDFASFEEASAAGNFQIGRGGFFVRPSTEKLESGDRVAFEFGFSKGTMPSIRGIGVVRWTRKKNGTLPTGVGIEIESLEETNRERFVEFLNLQCPKAYIPRS